MILQIARCNIHYRINKILYLAFLFMFIGSIFIARIDYGFYKKMNDSIFFACCLLIPIFMWMIHAGMKRYTCIGVCIIDGQFINLKYNTGELKRIEIAELLLIYGGYKGKNNRVWNILFTGNITKDGDNNYLVFNNDFSNKVQILLRSKKEYKDFQNLLIELEASGIKTQKVHYAVFGFKDIYKKLTPR